MARREFKHLPLSQDLLEYYRSRVEAVEEERASFIAKIDQCDVAHEDLHRTKWEARKRMDEIRDLQKALSDAQVYLYDERQQLLAVVAENDELKIRVREDKQRIDQLLALTQPRHQEVTYFSDAPPQLMRRHPGPPSPSRGDTGLPRKEGSRKAAKVEIKSRTQSGKAGEGGGGGGGSNGRILRTVYMPNERVDTLLMTIESLRAQLEEQQALHRDTVSAYKEDRRRQMEEERVRAAADGEKIEELMRENERLNRLLRQNAREYLSLRHNAHVTQRVMKEDSEGLHAENVQLRQRAEDMENRTAAMIRLAEKNAQLTGEQMAEMFRAQAMEKEAALGALKEKAKRSEKQYEAKVRKLGEKSEMLGRRAKRLEQQKTLETEGYVQEIQQLRQRVRELEVKAYQDQRPADLERDRYELELLNAALATAGTSKKLTVEMNKIKAKLNAFENELIEVKA